MERTPSTLRHSSHCWLASFTLALVLASTASVAQEDAVDVPHDAAAAAVLADGAPNPGDRLVVREKTVYVPYEELMRVFEKEGRGIFLPYEEFLELWRRAGEKPPEIVPPKPPADVVVRGGSYRGAVEGDVARFAVELEVESLKEGWAEVTLPLRSVAIESVDVGDSRAVFAAHGDSYRLLVPDKGRFTIRLVFATRVESAPGRKTVKFGIPPLAVSHLELTIPESDARIDVEPAIAATRIEVAEDKATLHAFVGNASEVKVQWMPPAGKATEDAAVLVAEQASRAYLGERSLRLDVGYRFELARGEVAELRIDVPTVDGTRLVSVKGENIREWNLDGSVLTVGLHSPVKDSYLLSLAFQRILDETPDSIRVPLPRAQGVLRESGWLALGHDSTLSTHVNSANGLSQLDPEEVPAALRQDLRVGFRFLAPPEPLDIAVTTITPVVRSQTTSVVVLGRERDLWVGFVDYDIRRAGLFRLALRVPDRWTVEEIGEADKVDGFQVSDPENGFRTITVNLKSRQIGTFRLPFRLTTTSGSAVEGETVATPPVVLDSEQDRGLFGVAAPRAIEIVTLARERTTSTDYQELYRSGVMSQLSVEADPLAYAYSKTTVAEPASVRLDLKSKQEEVHAIAQHLVEVSEAGRVKVTHFLDYEILYKEVDTLQFVAPSSLDATLKIDPSREYKEHSIEALGDGSSRWTVTLQGPTIGNVSLVLPQELAPEELVAGVARELVVPLVSPRDGVYKSRVGFVAVRKEGTLEITSVSDMDRIDEAELPDKLRRGSSLAAYRYVKEQKALTLRMTRYDPVHLARTVVNLLHVTAVLSEDPCKLTARATLLVRNSDAQYLEIRLPTGARTRSVHVAGRRETTKQRKEATSELIAIPRTTGAPVAVRIEYEHDLGAPMGSFGSLSAALIEVLEVAERPVPVEKTELELYVPRDLNYLGFSGNLRRRATGSETWMAQLAAWLSPQEGEAQFGRSIGDPAPGAGGDIQLDRLIEGKTLHLFETMARLADVGLWYVEPSIYLLVALLLFVLTFAIGAFAASRAPNARVGIALAAFLAPLAIAWVLSGGLAGLFLASSFGGLALVVVFAFRWTSARARSWRAERLRVAPDPFLEEAIDEPPPSKTQAANVEESPATDAAKPTTAEDSSNDAADGTSDDKRTEG